MQQIQAEVKHASTMSNCRWNQSDSNVPMHDLGVQAWFVTHVVWLHIPVHDAL